MKLYAICPNLYISAWPDGRPSVDIVVNVAQKKNPLADIHLPLQDLGKFDEDSYLFVRDKVIRLMRDNSVLVHCYLGRNRSAFVAALIYCSLYGASGLDAIRHIRSIKGNVLANSNFVRFLEFI